LMFVLQKTELEGETRAEQKTTNTHIHTAHAHSNAVAHGWRAILCLLAYLDDSGIAEAAVIKGTTMETVMMIGIPLHATGKEGGRKSAVGKEINEESLLF